MKSVIICNPVIAGPAGCPATVRDCTNCGAEVWIAFSMLQRVDSGELQPHCLLCGREYMLANPTAQLQPPTAEQFREIREALAR